MTLFGYRIPMMASLLVWCLLWEIVGRAEHDAILVPPFTSRARRAPSIWCSSGKFQTATVTTLRAFAIGMALAIVVGVALGVLMGARAGGRPAARHVGQSVRQRAALGPGARADDPVRHRRDDDRRHRLPVRRLDHRARHPRRRAARLAVAGRDGPQLRRQPLAALSRASSSGRRCRRSSPGIRLGLSAASRAW